MRCEALSCGQREYLYDDLEVLRLSESAIAYPPLILWPQLIFHAVIPQDVEAGLIRPLNAEGITIGATQK